MSVHINPAFGFDQRNADVPAVERGVVAEEPDRAVAEIFGIDRQCGVLADRRRAVFENEYWLVVYIDYPYFGRVVLSRTYLGTDCF